jgi:hypothetical protein
LPQIEVPEHLVPALTRMLAVSAKKKQDYSGETPWANFLATSEHFGIPSYESADFNEIQKLSRIKTLRKSGVNPQNESVEDTYLDKAVYALLAYAMYLAVHTTEVPHEPVNRDAGVGAIRKCCPTADAPGSAHYVGCASSA